MLTKAEINEVLIKAKNIRQVWPMIRKGQAFYIALFNIHTQIALSIDETEYDPFCDDSKLDACIEYLTKEKK